MTPEERFERIEKLLDDTARNFKTNLELLQDFMADSGRRFEAREDTGPGLRAPPDRYKIAKVLAAPLTRPQRRRQGIAMETREWKTIDKSGLQPGPWDDEPDRFEWRDAGNWNAVLGRQTTRVRALVRVCWDTRRAPCVWYRIRPGRCRHPRRVSRHSQTTARKLSKDSP